MGADLKRAMPSPLDSSGARKQHARRINRNAVLLNRSAGRLRTTRYALAEQAIVRVANGRAEGSIMQRDAKALCAHIAVRHIIAVGGNLLGAGNAIAVSLHLRVRDVAAVRRELGCLRHAVASQLQVAVLDAHAWSLPILSHPIAHALLGRAR